MTLEPDQAEAVDGLFAEREAAEALAAAGFEPSRKLFFAGPPGVGKTMLAGALAHRLELPLGIVRTDGCVNSYLGKTGKNYAWVFEQIAARPAVYLFDEADSVMTQRGGAASGASREMERVTNGLLERIDEDASGNLIIAASNIAGQIDRALLRRFDRVVSFRLPARETLEQVIRHRLAALDVSGVDFAAVLDSLAGGSHADASGAAAEAGKRAVMAGRAEILTADLVDAALERAKRRALKSSLGSATVEMASPVAVARTESAVRQPVRRPRSRSAEDAAARIFGALADAAGEARETAPAGPAERGAPPAG